MKDVSKIIIIIIIIIIIFAKAQVHFVWLSVQSKPAKNIFNFTIK